jgi:transposase
VRSGRRRRIRRVTVKEMLMLKFYQFLQRLAARAEEEGATIIRVYEGCTTKTCTACGVIKNNVGGAKTLRCTPCGVRLPRDLVGARNIFLRFLERGCAEASRTLSGALVDGQHCTGAASCWCLPGGEG